MKVSKAEGSGWDGFCLFDIKESPNDFPCSFRNTNKECIYVRNRENWSTQSICNNSWRNIAKRRRLKLRHRRPPHRREIHRQLAHEKEEGDDEGLGRALVDEVTQTKPRARYIYYLLKTL
jgi:hypothetical protein